MQSVFLLALVAFAAFCNAQDHPLTPCIKDSDCNQVCRGSVGVCSPNYPQHHCHCHAAEIPCTIDDNCKASCASGQGCCHNHDHCHCDEVCGHYHHHH